MSKAKVELTAETVRTAIEGGKFFSMTQLAHHLGYKGTVSGSLTKKLRQLIPEIDDLLTANKPTKDAKPDKPAKDDTGDAVDASTSTTPELKAGKLEFQPKPVKSPRGKGGKYPQDPRNPFRAGSNYSLVFNVLAAHPNGIEKTKLVELVSAASGKDITHAGYDCQVLLSAHGNEPGLSRNDGPRHRSCRMGFWVKRINGNVQLVVDKDG